MPVKVTDRGAEALLKRMKQRGVVRVGIMGQKAVDQHEGAKGKGLTVAQIAEYHEFGMGVPRRSWLRDYVDENERSIREWLKIGATLTEKGQDLHEVLDLVGWRIVSGINRRIDYHIPPPLKEATTKRKGSTTPLVDTGQLRSSITYVVAKDEGTGTS